MTIAKYRYTYISFVISLYTSITATSVVKHLTFYLLRPTSLFMKQLTQFGYKCLANRGTFKTAQNLQSEILFGRKIG